MEEEIPRLPVAVYTPSSVRTDHSCFSAGTPVWTSEGPVAIENLQTGDRVLSSDLDSGALLYATVLYRTERQTDAKYDLEFHSETIQASASHPFWSVDEGWIPAKDTLAGNSLKTAHGVVLLDDVRRLADSDPAVASPVYNLVVDGTHTYFVGQSQCLVHDDTIPRPRDAEAVTSFAFSE